MDMSGFCIHAAGLHISSFSRDKLAMISIAVDLQPQQFKGVQIQDCNIILLPVSSGQRIAMLAADKTILLGDG